MFSPCSRSFKDVAGDLYLPASFEAPPPALSLPPGHPEWLYYGGEDGKTAPPFSDFMRTEAFKQVQGQLLEGALCCEGFAERHFSAEEADIIKQGFARFRQKLLLDDGLRFIGINRLPVLYGLGKQSFDNFRLLLDHPGIELHLRKAALRELSSQVQTCLSTGPAFTQALMQLQRPDGSLRGQYWQALQQLMDDAVRRFVNMVWVERKGWSIKNDECHLVNRFRLELGLPGALHDDLLSRGATLVSKAEVDECAQSLLRDCRPVAVARQLASLYRERLVERTAQVLNLPPSGIDLNDDLHMSMLRKSAADLAPTFVGTSLRSLIEEDLETESFRWRQDDSLVARDLLLELARQGYVREPAPGTWLRGQSRDGAAAATTAWAVRHLDQRLVYLQEHLPGLGSAGEITSIRLEHLLRLMKKRGRCPTGPMVSTVLQSEPPEVLMRFPAAALEDAQQAALLLRRLGLARSEVWGQSQPLIGSALPWLLTAATREGHAGLLTHLLGRLAGERPMSLITLAGGPDILALALGQGTPAIAMAWMDVCQRALPEMPATTLAALLAKSNDRPLLHEAMLRSPPEVLRGMLALVDKARTATLLRPGGYVRHLSTPVDDAMALNRLEPLEILGRHLMAAARRGWLVPSELQVALEGPRAGDGCLGAVEAGSVAGVAWFQSVVIEMGEAHCLRPTQAGAMLCGTGAKTSAQAVAVDVGNHAVLAAVLEGVRAAAERGWVSEVGLMEALALPDDKALSSLGRMLLKEDRRCAQAWTQALLALYRQRSLSPDQIAALLSLPVVNEPDLLGRVPSCVGAPLPFMLAWLADAVEGSRADRYLEAGERLASWGQTLASLADAGALRREQLLDLLAARNRNLPALQVAMRRGKLSTIMALMEVYFQMRGRGLIDEEDLERLLAVWPPMTQGVALRPPVEAVASDFVHLLLRQLRAGQLSDSVFVRLATPVLRGPMEPLDSAELRARHLARQVVRRGESQSRSALATERRGSI